MGSGVDVRKLISADINKIVCLLWVRLGPARVKQFKVFHTKVGPGTKSTKGACSSPISMHSGLFKTAIN
jgi:hypothetical protein